jgi:hypothetical protein
LRGFLRLYAFFFYSFFAFSLFSLLFTPVIPQTHHQMTELDIRRVFERCGEIILIKICGNPTQETRFAFVEFGTLEGARAAQSLDGTPVTGYNLRCVGV